MVAGPMDYTPGAMRNSLKGMYYPNKKNPMSQGTRAHQVAAFVVFDSPFNVLADSPSRYIKEDETTRFIAQIPTVWDETVALDGKIGEYVVVAHRMNDKWYIGALNNWTSRDLVIDLSNIISHTSSLEIFADGKNSEKVPEDYVNTTINIPADGKIKIKLAPGGGWAAIQK
jgi:alpha-glucosidase